MNTGGRRSGDARYRRNLAAWRGALAIGYGLLVGAAVVLGTDGSLYAVPVAILGIGLVVACYAHGSPRPPR